MRVLNQLGPCTRASTQAVAGRLSVAPASATGMLEKLASLRLVEHTPYRGATLGYLWALELRPGARVEMLEAAPFGGPVTFQLQGQAVSPGARAADRVLVRAEIRQEDPQRRRSTVYEPDPLAPPPQSPNELGRP